MKALYSGGIVLSVLLGCSDQKISSSQDSFSTNEPTKYVIGSSYGFSDFLGKRLSLIVPNAAVYLLYGTQEPFIWALSTTDRPFTEGSYRYLLPDQIYRFDLLPKLPSSKTAEIADHDTQRPIGNVIYSFTTDNDPYFISNLCSGVYEDVCDLSYDKELKKFNLKLTGL